MTTKPTLWSINALADELELDRRTVKRRLRDVPPSGQRGGHPVFKLADAVEAIARNGGRSNVKDEAPPAPPSFERLAGLPALDQIGTFAILEMAYRAPAQAGVLAVAAGAGCAAAYALRKALMLSLSRLAVDTARICQLQPLADNPNASLFDLTAFAECDWHALAQLTGEAVDLEAWERQAIERFAETGSTA